MHKSDSPLHFSHNAQFLVSALSSSCHLFRQCELQCGCRGCVTGPGDCAATCRVPQVRGEGVWFCDGYNKSVTQVHCVTWTLTVSLTIFVGPKYSHQWKVFLQMWRQAPADGDFIIKQLLFLLFIIKVTCLSGDWDQDVEADLTRFGCPVR